MGDIVQAFVDQGLSADAGAMSENLSSAISSLSNEFSQTDYFTVRAIDENLNGLTSAVDYGWDDHLTTMTSIIIQARDLGASYDPTINKVVPNYTGTTPTILVPDDLLPDLDASAPLVTYPNTPSLSTPSKPTAPVVETATTPTAPVYTDPESPELLDISIPDVTAIVMPEFNAEFPLLDEALAVPSVEFSYEEPEYTSDELVELRNTLVSDLQNGGWGVTHEDEEKLFSRQIDRATQAAVTREREAIELAASKGFPIPNGAMLIALRKSQQDTVLAVNEANRDVSTTRADLIRKARESAITNSIALNQTMVTHFGFSQQRAIEAAKAVVDYSLSIFAAQVGLYNTRIAAFNAQFAYYESQIRAQVIKLEGEKAQIQAQAIRGQVNADRISIYNSELRAVAILVDIYNAQMQATNIAADIERSKVSIYATQVGAYKAEIDADITKVQSYSAQLSAEGTKVDVYKSQVSAYAAEVAAARVKSDTNVQREQLKISEYRADLEKYRADLGRYGAELEADKALARADLDKVLAEASGIRTAGQVETDRVSVLDNRLQYEKTLAAEIARLSIAEQTAQSELDKNMLELRTTGLVEPVEQYRKYFESLGSFASAIEIV